MSAPAPRNDGRNLEFIELYNSQPWFQDLGGYRVSFTLVGPANPESQELQFELTGTASFEVKEKEKEEKER